jgi:hypothetical protein
MRSVEGEWPTGRTMPTVAAGWNMRTQLLTHNEYVSVIAAYVVGRGNERERLSLSLTELSSS